MRILRGFVLGLGCVISGIYAAPHYYSTSTNSKNILRGDQVCDDGLTLEEATTVCRIESPHKLAGPLHLNGGTIQLARDVTIAPTATVTTGGRIDGKGNMLTLLHQHESWQLPVRENCYGIYSEAPLQPTNLIGGAGWCADTSATPLFAAADLLAPGSFRIYGQSGYQLEERIRTSLPSGTGVQHIQWCPTAPMGVCTVVHRDGSKRIYSFVYDVASNRLDLDSILPAWSNNVVASWSQNGNRLAIISVAGSTQIKVYERSAATLIESISGVIPSPMAEGQVFCVWDAIGQSCVVSRQTTAHTSQILVVRATGSAPVVLAQKDIDGVVSALDFSLPSSSQFLIALCCVSATHQSRLQVGHITHEDGVTVVNTHSPYFIDDDIYALLWGARNSQLALLTRQEGGVSQLALYNVSGIDTPGAEEGSMLPTLERSAVHIHTNAYAQLAWAHHDQQLVVLDQSGGLHHFTALDGMTLKDLTLVANGDIRWVGGLYIQQNVLCAGNNHAWQLPAHARIRLDDGARLTVHNAHLQIGAACDISTPGSAECVLDSCIITGGGLTCHAPTTLRGLCHLASDIAGDITIADRTQIMLHADTRLSGAVHVAGAVTVTTNGYHLIVDPASVTTVPGAVLNVQESGVSAVRAGTASTQTTGSLLIDRPTFDLQNDMLVPSDAPITITTNTVLSGNGHRLYFADSAHAFAIDQSVTSVTLSDVVLDGIALDALQKEGLEVVLAGTTTVLLGKDSLVSNTITCTGSTSIDGRGYSLTLEAGGKIQCAAGTLQLSDISVYGVQDDRLSCANDVSSVVLKRSSLNLSGDLALAYGAWVVQQDVSIMGGHTVMHSTTMPVVLQAEACLFLSEKATWQYASSSAQLVCNTGAGVQFDDATFESLVPADMTHVTLEPRGLMNIKSSSGQLVVRIDPAAGAFVHVYGDVVFA